MVLLPLFTNGFYQCEVSQMLTIFLTWASSYHNFKKISLGKSLLSLYLIPPSVPYSSKSETKHKKDKNDPYINKGYVFVLSDLNSVRRH